MERTGERGRERRSIKLGRRLKRRKDTKMCCICIKAGKSNTEQDI